MSSFDDVIAIASSDTRWIPDCIQSYLSDNTLSSNNESQTCKI